MVVKICDRCGKMIKKNYPTLDRVYNEENSAKILKEYDLCDECWASFYRWVNNVPENRDANTVNEEDSEKIDELELSVRAYDALYRAGIKTIDDLCKLTETELRKIKNIGKVSAEEVITALTEKGRHLFVEEDRDDEN